MKKIIILSFWMICMFGIAGMATAGDFNAVMGEGEIALPCNTSPTCNGPGVGAIALSGNSYVVYSAAANVCGIGNTIGQGMGVLAQSGKGTNNINLRFVVVANQTPGMADDNNVYQEPTGALATALPAMETSLSGYTIRGTTTVVP